MNTEDTSTLIERLSRQATPVRSLHRPWVRASVWLVISGMSIVAIGLLMPLDSLPSRLAERTFLIEQAGALMAGAGAAVAAFASVVPGSNRKLIGFLLLPLAVWLGSLCAGCLNQLARTGLEALPGRHSLLCFPYITILGIVPAVAMTLMLRRGAPLTPYLTVALGAFSSAGLANFFLRILYPEEVTVMLVVWHVGGVFLLTILASLGARYVLAWRRITTSARSPGG